ncbi:2-hydroxychromene-2-carboxylate isomerase [Methylopila henanensis]|uniref:2-hydroxychromene-2-carboxylate isomerase n=1 Tax=Methylopila henanensis TaxID=873516 RepID=A0ABW4K6L7_9HYPH
MNADRPQIDYYFSFISLWSYVGSLPFQDLVRRTGAEVTFKPIDLLAVFAAGGGKPVKERPKQRQAYRLVEMQRWREIRGIPLVLQPRFYPANPSVGHRMVLAAIREALDVTGFVHAGLKAVWADELDIAAPETLVALADANGLPGRRLLEQAWEDTALGETEASLTREAVDRLLFGAPFYFYRGEPFWGQDRLDLLERAIVEGTEPIPFDPS